LQDVYAVCVDVNPHGSVDFQDFFLLFCLCRFTFGEAVLKHRASEQASTRRDVVKRYSSTVQASKPAHDVTSFVNNVTQIQNDDSNEKVRKSWQVSLLLQQQRH
jgi:hypothetical protein